MAALVYPENKIAQTSYTILPEIAERWSPRAFDNNRPVENEKISRFLEAARWSASSYNEQPWRFIIGNKFEDPKAHEALKQLLVDGNRWAFDVPLLLLSVAKNDFTQTDSYNRVAMHDVGLAMGNLVLQAQTLGLHVHMMGGFYVDKAYTTFGIPENEYTPVAMAAIGYLGNPKQLSEEWQQKAELAERHRKPLQEIVFTGQWGRPYSGSFT